MKTKIGRMWRRGCLRNKIKCSSSSSALEFLNNLAHDFKLDRNMVVKYILTDLQRKIAKSQSLP